MEPTNFLPAEALEIISPHLIYDHDDDQLGMFCLTQGTDE
jgi:hypothetical protein